MEGIRGTLPITIRYLPESLLSIFSRPGKILEAKVETLEGRLVSLFIGGERLEAMLSPQVSPRHLRPGQTVKLKLVDTGPPVILSLLSTESEKAHFYKEITNFLKNLSKIFVSHQLLKLDEQLSIENLLLNTFLVLEKNTKNKEIVSISDQEKREFVTLLPKFWENGIFFLPFMFLDKLSWGFLLEEERKNKSKNERVFYLRLFLSNLGLLEIVFRLILGKKLYLTILAAREEALVVIQRSLLELYDALKGKNFHVHIDTGLLETSPGVLLVTEG